MIAKCIRCATTERVQRAGFVRGQQRFFCRACDHYFLEPKESARRKPSQTTLADIAAALGLATSTVSRALSNSSEINARTRQAVAEMARQLNYQPNLLAKSLQSNQTYTIGVVVPDLERPFFATAVSGIQQVATEAGYKVMICQSKESYLTEVSSVQMLIANQVDGLLICHARETENFDHVSAQACRSVPLVHFDRVHESSTNSQVVIDDWNGAFAITEHLILEGCRRIAVLAGPASLLISQKRVAGYRSALRRYQLPLTDELVTYTAFQTDATLATLRQWLELPTPPDAIFAIRYTDALTIIAELKRRKVRIPQEIAVVGFGDELLATMIEPSLTTVDLHPQRIGQQAAQLFLEQVAQQEYFQPRTCIIPGEVIIRQSSLKGQGKLFRLSI